jgi:hypothetical protein
MLFTPDLYVAWLVGVFMLRDQRNDNVGGFA